MRERGVILLDYLELIVSILGSIIFFISFIIIKDQQRFLFLITTFYLIYNGYNKIKEMKLLNRRPRIVKYYGKRVKI